MIILKGIIMNLENMVLGSELSKLKSSIKKIFFYRICGTGMGACACLAKELGLEVAGADITFSPPMSTYLESLDIDLFDLKNLKKEVLKDYDLIVVGNSVPRGSEHAKFIEQCGLKFTSFPSFLGEFLLKDKSVVGICGTHGKTTTTYFLTQMLEVLGEDPGYFIGGIIDHKAPSHLGTSDYFIIEADEYDSAYFQKISKFRLYEMNHMILTSLEFDHADIFSSIEDIKNEFESVLPSLPGEIIANDAYKEIFELKEKYQNKPWMIYGQDSSIGPQKIEVHNGMTQFQLKLGNSYVSFETNVIGEHNILNISSCLLLLHKLNFNTIELKQAVKSLGMVKRRQELRGSYKGSLVIDDFAHHPRAIDLTLKAIRQKYPNKKILTVFEPISATARSDIFQEEFYEALKLSDEVILAVSPIHTSVRDHENLDCVAIRDKINQNEQRAYVVRELIELRELLDQKVDESTLFLILSNRTCLGLWESDFVKALS